MYAYGSRNIISFFVLLYDAQIGVSMYITVC